MSDTVTPNLGLVKPDVGGSDDMWGEKLNSNFDIIDEAISGGGSGAVTKAYVDIQDELRVAVGGDVMTGFLTLSADPIANLHAVTKQYADSINIVWKGSWVNTTNYIINDAVAWNGASYIAVAASGPGSGGASQPPSAAWNLLAAAGTAGDMPQGTAGYLFAANGVGIPSSFQGFTQAGTGAVQRAWQSKLRDEFVSVKDFGAVGDGVANDTVAIQKALDHDRGANCGVFVPPGRYRIGALTIYPATRLYGANRMESIFEAIDSLNATMIAIVTANSATSATPSTGSKTFTIAAGMYFPIGAYVLIVNTLTNWMQGTVTAYSGTTLTVNVTYATGSTTAANWFIFLNCDDVEIAGLTLDGRRNRSGVTSNNTLGDCLVVCGWRPVIRDLDILHAPVNGMVTRAMQPGPHFDRGVEGIIDNVRIDNPGTTGWRFLGPNDCTVSNVAVIDASAANNGVGYGIQQQVLGNGKFSNVHIWNWAITTSFADAGLAIATSGNIYANCHFESGNTCVRVTAQIQNFVGCKIYAPDSDSCLDLQAGYVCLAGCTIGPPGVTPCHGVRLRAAAVYCLLDFEAFSLANGAVWFDGDAGNNVVVIRGDNSSGLAYAGTPHSTNRFSMRLSGGLSGANTEIFDPITAAAIGTAIGKLTSFTPVLVPGAGSISAQVHDCAYAVIGKLAFLTMSCQITAGTGLGGSLQVTNLPVAPRRAVYLAGREAALSGKTMALTIGGGATSGFAFNYDNGNPSVAVNALYMFSGAFEIA
jgi:hypothetical protein